MDNDSKCIVITLQMLYSYHHSVLCIVIKIMFKKSSYSGSEGNNQIPFKVQPVLVLTIPSSSSITVVVESMDATATGKFLIVQPLYNIFLIGGEDYTAGPYSVTIPPNMTEVSFNVNITGDNLLENNETLKLSLSSSTLPDRVTVDPSEVTVTIIDNDGKLLF